MKVRKTKKFLNKISLIGISILCLLGPTVYFYLKNPRRVKAAPWPQAAGSWLSRKQISLVNNSGATLHSNTTYTITFNTKSIYDQGYLKTNCDDLRVFYQPSDTNSVDLYRHTLPPTGYTCATSTTTKISFPLQADISNGSTDSNYYIYYNNSAATSYSDADALKAYNVGAKTATFMAPFNGSTTALAAGSGTPTTETGAIRYSGNKSALKFDGRNDQVAYTNNNLDNLLDNAATIEFWAYYTPKEGSDVPIGKRGSSSFGWIVYFNNNQVNFWVGCSSQLGMFSTPVGTLTYNNWNNIAVIWDSVNKVPVIFVNGESKSVTTNQACLGSYSGDTGNTFYVGRDNEGGQFYPGLIDEVRLSNIARYSSNFTPQTTPFVRDEFTKLLLHFDENGDDPRNTGKAIDDSGNANHGTVTGAKYVAGLIGVDTSTTDTGYQFNQTYGGHEGIFIEEGTTNKITNPSFEHSTYDTNWTAGGNTTATENTTAPYYKFGSKSAKLVASADDTFLISINPASTSTHTLSAYVYDGTSGNVGGTVSSTVAKLVFNGSVVTPSAYTDMGGGWWRLSYSAAGVDAAGNYGVSILSGRTVYVDGVQLEEKGYATTYTDGTLGTGYAWTGVANESTSTRTAEDLIYSEISNISGTKGSISMWVNRERDCGGWASARKCAFFNYGVLGSGYNNQLVLAYDGASFKFRKHYGGNPGTSVDASVTLAFNKGSWYHLTATWSDSEGMNLYVNSSNSNSKVDTGTLDTSPLYIGKGYYDSSVYTGGRISDTRIFDNALTSTEVADLYYSGLGSHKEGVEIEQFTDGEPPISVWHLDENTGTTINDSMSANDGTLASGDATPTWATGTNCIEDSCLQFDGTDDYASIANGISGIKTLSFWVKPSAATTSVFDLNGTQTVTITDNVIAANSFTSPTIYVNGIQTTTVPTNSWSQVVITTSTSIGASSFNFGKVSTSYFSGYLDEIKIFPYVISTTQINKEVNVGSAVVVGGGAGTAQITPIKSKLVGYWKFDEGYGTLANNSGNGGRALNGTITGATWKNDGKFSKALYFDGDDWVNAGTNSITGTSAYTISAWVKGSPMSGYGGAVGIGNGASTQLAWIGWVNTAQVGTSNSWGGGGYSRNYGTGVTDMSGWHHLVLTSSGGSPQTIKIYVDNILKVTGSENFNLASTSTKIGVLDDNGTNNYWFKGLVDEVKIYNSALSDDEIKQDYNYGSALKFAAFSDTSNLTGGSVASSSATAAYCIPGDTSACSAPVGEWNFEEGSGTIANNSLGGNYPGTLTFSPSWSVGKYGKSLKFDGVNSYVDVSDNANLSFTNEQLTISSWVYIDQVKTGAIVSKGECGVVYPEYQLLINGSANPLFSVYNSSGTAVTATGSTILLTNTWYYLAGTYNGSSINIYINGILDGTTNGSVDMHDTASNLTIGARDALESHPSCGSDYTVSEFKGKIDQVRIFSYARTPAQIAWDYNRGKALAHYKFDECSGTTLHSSNDAYNAALNGTLTVGGQGTQDGAGNCSDGDTSNSWYNGRIGKYNSSLNFDGTDDYVGVGSTLSYVRALSFWAKPSSTTQKIMELSASDSVEISSGAVSVTGFGTETVYVDGKVTSVFPDTNWHQVTVVSSSDITANTINIGKVSTTYYSGQIDDVQIFNYALTASQAKLLFNQGAGVRFGPNTGSE